MKINILFIITKLELGGAQKQLLSLIERLDREKYNIALFTAKRGLLLGDALRIKGIKIRQSPFLGRPINPIKDFIAFLELYAFILRNKIDIVHTHSSKAGILGRVAAGLAKVKVIVHTVHGWSFNDCQPFYIRRFFIRLERICAKFTDKIIVVSDCDKQRGLKNRIGREDKYEIVFYGINEQDFDLKDDSLKHELGIKDNEITVTMVSCLKPQKSPVDFVRLAYLVQQKLSNVKFILVGDGVLRPKIEGLIDKLNLKKQVILLGWRRDIGRILSITDIFVLTSLWEGFPVSVLEAASAGIPVVATDTGGIKEVIEDGRTGYLVSRRNINAMGARLGFLLRDRDARINMGQMTKARLDGEFKIENMVNKHVQLYADLASYG